MACSICKTRREKRHCPGVEGEICTLCCGTQREETIDCPLDCEYLQHAHQYESLDKDPAGMPNADFLVPRDFMDKNVEIIVLLEQAILKVALERNAVDFDIAEALDGLVRTYKTLGSGLYYESRPANPMAAAIFDSVQRRVEEIRTTETKRGVHKLLDSQVLNVLVYLQHMEYAFDNGRRRGRSFVRHVYGTVAEVMQDMQPDPSSLIIS